MAHGWGKSPSVRSSGARDLPASGFVSLVYYKARQLSGSGGPRSASRNANFRALPPPECGKAVANRRWSAKTRRCVLSLPGRKPL